MAYRRKEIGLLASMPAAPRRTGGFLTEQPRQSAPRRQGFITSSATPLQVSTCREAALPTVQCSFGCNAPPIRAAPLASTPSLLPWKLRFGGTDETLNNLSDLSHASRRDLLRLQRRQRLAQWLAGQPLVDSSTFGQQRGLWRHDQHRRERFLRDRRCQSARKSR